MRMDDRETVDDLKREVAKRLGNLGKEMGVPDLGRAKLSEVRAAGTLVREVDHGTTAAVRDFGTLLRPPSAFRVVSRQWLSATDLC